MNTSGFYKKEEELLYAPNSICSPDYDLVKEYRDQYDYPVDGWYWFDSKEQACTFLGIEDNDQS